MCFFSKTITTTVQTNGIIIENPNLVYLFGQKYKIIALIEKRSTPTNLVKDDGSGFVTWIENNGRWKILGSYSSLNNISNYGNDGNNSSNDNVVEIKDKLNENLLNYKLIVFQRIRR